MRTLSRSSLIASSTQSKKQGEHVADNTHTHNTSSNAEFDPATQPFLPLPLFFFFWKSPLTHTRARRCTCACAFVGAGRRFERIHRGPKVEQPRLAVARDLVVTGAQITLVLTRYCFRSGPSLTHTLTHSHTHSLTHTQHTHSLTHSLNLAESCTSRQKRVANTNHFSRRSPRRKKKGGAGKVAKASSPSTTPSPSPATASTASCTPAGLRKPAAATTTPITKANRERAGVLAEDLESPLLVLRAATRKAQEQNSASGQQEPESLLASLSTRSLTVPSGL